MKIVPLWRISENLPSVSGLLKRNKYIVVMGVYIWQSLRDCVKPKSAFEYVQIVQI